MRKIRVTDMVWLFFLGALAALVVTKPEHSVYEWLVLLLWGGPNRRGSSGVELGYDRRGAGHRTEAGAVLLAGGRNRRR